MKTLIYKLIVPEDGVDNVDDLVTDYLYNATEGVEIVSEMRDATEEEVAIYVQGAGQFAEAEEE